MWCDNIIKHSSKTFRLYSRLLLVCNAFQAGSGECSCGGKLSKGTCVKPIKGNAVLFWSMVSILCFKEIIDADFLNALHNIFVVGILRDWMESQIRIVFMEDVRYSLGRSGQLQSGWGNQVTIELTTYHQGISPFIFSIKSSYYW